MAQVIEMPKLSDTMEEGAIATWLKKEGEFIEEGEAFVEIETDKATMEYNSPVEGTLLKILVPAGKGAALNAPIAVVGEKGEKVDVDALAKGAGGKAKAEEAKTSSQAPAAAAPQPNKQAASAAAPARPSAQGATITPIRSGDRLRASPLAKKIAAEKGVDIAAINGSGPHGRVIIRDVEAALQGGAAPMTARAPGAQPAPMPVGPAAQGDQDIPNTMMRKTIAKRLLEGKNEAPHFYLTVSADMGRLNEWRARLNTDAENSGGKIPKVSVNDVIILAVTKALRKHPQVNASWQGEFIRQYGNVHMAVAVALPQGLITPVVRFADQLGVREIAVQSRTLIQKAKDGQLQPQDYTGGTFTISNLGMMGIEQFTAIINPPQAAILAVGATINTPWVNEKNEVVVRPRMTMTMSCDHRVVDGAVGASFLQTLVSFLEDPLMMLG